MEKAGSDLRFTQIRAPEGAKDKRKSSLFRRFGAAPKMEDPYCELWWHIFYRRASSKRGPVEGA